MARMKLETVVDAIRALEDAARALQSGCSIPEQMNIGRRCAQSAARLQLAIERKRPEIVVTQ